jgi:hypothetical protein
MADSWPCTSASCGGIWGVPGVPSEELFEKQHVLLYSRRYTVFGTNCRRCKAACSKQISTDVIVTRLCSGHGG